MVKSFCLNYLPFLYKKSMQVYLKYIWIVALWLDRNIHTTTTKYCIDKELTKTSMRCSWRVYIYISWKPESVPVDYVLPGNKETFAFLFKAWLWYCEE